MEITYKSKDAVEKSGRREKKDCHRKDEHAYENAVSKERRSVNALAKRIPLLATKQATQGIKKANLASVKSAEREGERE